MKNIFFILFSFILISCAATQSVDDPYSRIKTYNSSYNNVYNGIKDYLISEGFILQHSPDKMIVTNFKRSYLYSFDIPTRFNVTIEPIDSNKVIVTVLVDVSRDEYNSTGITNIYGRNLYKSFFNKIDQYIN